MTLLRHVGRSLAISAALAFVATASPAFAFGNRGDSRQVSALTEDTPGGAHAAPEIDAGAAIAAVALVAGVITVLRSRRGA
jgi:hypothetical protein